MVMVFVEEPSRVLRRTNDDRRFLGLCCADDASASSASSKASLAVNGRMIVLLVDAGLWRMFTRCATVAVVYCQAAAIERYLLKVFGGGGLVVPPVVVSRKTLVRDPSNHRRLERRSALVDKRLIYVFKMGWSSCIYQLNKWAGVLAL